MTCELEAKVKQKIGGQGKMGQDAVRLYELVTRRFLAAISPDVRFVKRQVCFELDGMRFWLRGNEILDWGFSQISKGAVNAAHNFYEMHSRNVLKGPRLEVAKTATNGRNFVVKDIRVRQLESVPPRLLSESELLTQMERKQIGTDASMATHVNNIVTRGYVEVLQPDRLMRPTILGVALIHGLQVVDKELTEPAVRARIERDVAEVAQGSRTCEDVVTTAVSIFREKFRRVREGIPQIRSALADAKAQRSAWEAAAAVAAEAAAADVAAAQAAATSGRSSEAAGERGGGDAAQDTVVEPPSVPRLAGGASAATGARLAPPSTAGAGSKLWQGAAAIKRPAQGDAGARNVKQRVGSSAAGTGDGTLRAGLRIEVRGGEGKPWRAGTVMGQRSNGKWEVLVDGWDKAFVWPDWRHVSVAAPVAGDDGGGAVAPEDDAELSPLELENKALLMKLSVAQLRAENAEIKLRDMEKKVAKLKRKLGAAA